MSAKASLCMRLAHCFIINQTVSNNRYAFLISYVASLLLIINNIVSCFVFVASGRDCIIQNPLIQARELFISEAQDTYPATSLR